MAHELSHVTQRHIARGIEARLRAADLDRPDDYRAALAGVTRLLR